jgi:STE24 endopeptidase
MAGSAGATWLGLTGLAGVAAWTGRRLCQRLHEGQATRESLLTACYRQRRRLVLGLVALFLTSLWLLGWGSTARSWASLGTGPIPGRELFILAPFLIGLVLLWVFAYDVERAVQDSCPRPADDPLPARSAYVILQARHNLILAVPPILLLLLQQLLVWWLPDLEKNETILAVLLLVLLPAVIVGIPWLLRLFLRLRPLPPCPLRERLQATAQRLGFRCNNILLWDTHHTLANAMVTGPLPVLRYVVLTDRLVRDMAPEEVEAVFGHEIGHVKHQHMLFYFGFLLASLAAVFGLWNVLTLGVGDQPVHAIFSAWLPWWPEGDEVEEVLTLLPLLTLVGAYVFVVFGFLSRRCERQADIYGCRTVSCPVFIAALEKVARLNGISRDRPGWLSSWQHSTIARRVDFCRRLSIDPGLGSRFQRRVGLIKWGLALCLGVVLTVLVLTCGWDVFNVDPNGGRDGRRAVAGQDSQPCLTGFQLESES